MSVPYWTTALLFGAILNIQKMNKYNTELVELLLIMLRELHVNKTLVIFVKNMLKLNIHVRGTLVVASYYLQYHITDMLKRLKRLKRNIIITHYNQITL